MPFDTTFFQLPCGVRCVRLSFRGAITAEESREHLKRVDSPEGDLYGLPALILTHEMDSISSEAKGVFARRGEKGDKEPWIATVITNSVFRVATSFYMRIQRTKRTKVFAAEAAALQWLDEQLCQQQAGKAEATNTPPHA